MKNITKKAVQVAAVICVTAGTVALVASGAAVKAAVEGGKYLKDTVRKIIDDGSEKEAEHEAETQMGEVITEPVPEAADIQEIDPVTEDTI